MIYADILISWFLAAVLEIYTQHFTRRLHFTQQWVLFRKYIKSLVPLGQLFSAWLHKVGKLYFKVPKSEIGKFLSSFRYHKYENF